jgi:hypothetical protein
MEHLWNALNPMLSSTTADLNIPDLNKNFTPAYRFPSLMLTQILHPDASQGKQRMLRITSREMDQQARTRNGV